MPMACAEVLLANPTAHAMGMVRAGRITVAPLRRDVGAVRRDGRPREVELDLPRERISREPAAVKVRLTRLPRGGEVLVLVEDITAVSYTHLTLPTIYSV